MADEWEKYEQILETEDKEIKEAMEAEVSTSSCPRFSSKCRILMGIEFITHYSMNFEIFK